MKLLQRLAGNRPMRNVVLNLVGGAWSGLLIVLATPWYVSQLGLAGYGIVGLWLMLQVMMGLLDMGIGASLTKGFADARPDSGGLAYKRDLLRTLEVVYWAIAASLALLLVASADLIATRWLRPGGLPAEQLDGVLRLMAVTLGLQFPGALYTNGLAGLHAHARMNAVQIAGNTLRYGGGAAVLLWRADLAWFFGVQIVVAALQTLGTRALVWKLVAARGAPSFRRDLVRQVSGFSTGMALTAVWAVLLANADRLVLSRMMDADALGRYAVAFAGSGLLQLGIQPFYRTFFPRYVELVSLSDPAGLRREYFHSCRMMAMLLVPLGLLGFVFAPELLYGWLGRDDATITATFRLLVLAITCSGLGWLPAAFQQAHGWTRLHTQMMAASVLVGMPLIVFAVPVFGVPGATAVWLVHGLTEITLGLWLMHRRLLAGDLPHWYRTVLLPPLVVAAPLVALSGWLMPHGLGRWTAVGWVAATALAAVALPLVLQRRRRVAEN